MHMWILYSYTKLFHSGTLKVEGITSPLTRRYLTIDMNGELVARNPEPQPRMDIEIQVDVAAYQQFGLECKLGKQFTDRKGRLHEPPKLNMLADSGAQVDCVSRDKLKRLGLNEYSLLKAEMSLGCANGSDAGIIGAFFGKVALKDKANNAVVRVIFYV